MSHRVDLGVRGGGGFGSADHCTSAADVKGHRTIAGLPLLLLLRAR